MTKKIWLGLLALVIVGASVAFALQDKPVRQVRYIKEKSILSQKQIPIWHYKIIKQYPHSENAFTQGLYFENGIIYESTGRYNESRLIKSELVNGKLLKQVKLPPYYFGEGATVLNDKIYQLTYRGHIGFIYNKSDLVKTGEFHVGRDAWGLTTDGTHLIMSDGSAKLYFIDPNNFETLRELNVTDPIGKVRYINEMEFIDGKIFANIWQTNLLVVINPNNGKVEAWVNLRGLNPNPEKLKAPYVLNGISYNPLNKTLLATGKHWPYIYELKLEKS